MHQFVEESGNISRRRAVGLGLGALVALIAQHVTAARLSAATGQSSVAAVDPMTAMAAANTAFSLVQRFTGSRGSDGGLGAMLRYQAELLSEVSNQLQSISTKLDELRAVLAQIPEETRLALREQFRLELLAGLAGSAVRYRTEILEPSRLDRSILSHPRGVQTLNEILSDVSRNRSTLQGLPEGRGPHACMSAPLAMALEVSCAGHLGEPALMLLGRLAANREWFDVMMGDHPQSIPSLERRALDSHEEIIRGLQRNALAQRLSINEFKLAGRQTGPVVDEICLVMGRDRVTHQGAELPIAPMILHVFNNTLRRKGVIEVRDHNGVGARLVAYLRTPPAVFSSSQRAPVQAAFGPFPVEGTVEPPSRSVTITEPVAGDVCRAWADGSLPDRTPVPAARAISIGEESTVGRRVLLERTELETSLARMNEERAMIALCTLARGVVMATRHQINEYQRILERR
jgi:hypothetical protein